MTRDPVVGHEGQSVRQQLLPSDSGRNARRAEAPYMYLLPCVSCPTNRERRAERTAIAMPKIKGSRAAS